MQRDAFPGPKRYHRVNILKLRGEGGGRGARLRREELHPMTTASQEADATSNRKSLLTLALVWMYLFIRLSIFQRSVFRRSKIQMQVYL